MIVNAIYAQIGGWMAEYGLWFSVEKIEIIILTGKRKYDNLHNAEDNHQFPYLGF